MKRILLRFTFLGVLFLLSSSLILKGENKRALILVDVQKDFCPGGALPVPEGDKVVPVLNKYIDLFAKKGWTIFASRDWHPENSIDFIGFGGKFPAHCVRNTEGAKFHDKLKLPKNVKIISTGLDPKEEGYSAFEGKELKDGEKLKGRPFLKVLKSSKITDLYVGGLATDFAVRATVLDGLNNGFKVTLLKDAIRGVYRDTSAQTIKEMTKAGAKLITYEALEKELSEE